MDEDILCTPASRIQCEKRLMRLEANFEKINQDIKQISEIFREELDLRMGLIAEKFERTMERLDKIEAQVERLSRCIYGNGYGLLSRVNVLMAVVVLFFGLILGQGVSLVWRVLGF